METILVIAPHPDDETLGCGGSILRHVSEGKKVHWLIATNMQKDYGFSEEQIKTRKEEINKVTDFYSFSSVHRLNFPTCKLDEIPFNEVIESIGKVINKLQPDTIYLPFKGDAHSDHMIIYNASVVHTKWFRNKKLSQVLIYETLSETDFQNDVTVNTFRPNLYIDISKYIEGKLKAMSVYESETGEFPFPRSLKSIEVLAQKRGIESGFRAAEAFMILRQRK